MRVLKLIILSASVFLSCAVKADTIENAYVICYALDGSGALSEECKISGWNQSIDISIDTSASKAKEFCAAVVQLAKKERMKFGKDWKIRVYSPFSNGKTIAFCSLPQ